MTALHSPEYRRFAEALVAARRKAGLSQYDVADRLGLPQWYISKCENGRRRLDVIEFLQLVAAMGVDYREVLDAIAVDLDARLES